MNPEDAPKDAMRASLDLTAITSRPSQRQAFPAPALRRPEPQVIVRQSVRNAIHRHGGSRADVEICGVLLGDICQDDAGAFVYVQASIRGEHAGSQLAQVTFTAETWSHVQSVMDRDFPDLRVLGWYHTHPGFGIFLSAMDLFIHRNFFNHPEQLALVFDPISGEEGVFVWRNGEPTREAVVIEEDEPASAKSMNVGALPALSAAGDDFAARISRVEKQQRWLMMLLGALALAAFLWPVALSWKFGRIAPGGREPLDTQNETTRSPQSSADRETIRQDVDGNRPVKAPPGEHSPPKESPSDYHSPEEEAR